MNKKILLTAASALLFHAAHAQPITITAADMPVAGDTLRYSQASPLGLNLNLSNTGANIAWDYSNLTPVIQGIDTYKTAAQVHISYAATISPAAYGIKIADTISVPGAPISATNVYTFFSKKPASNPNRFVAEGFAAQISGIPTPAVYSDEDEWYFFPLDYNDRDTSTFNLNVSIFGLGTLRQIGTRTTHVDGWGTIKTPYHSTPVACLRIRSEVVEIDSVIFGSTKMGLPRHTVDYRWLANGEHYPALWVTANIVGGTETPTMVRYRDTRRQGTSVSNSPALIRSLSAYPNPATNGMLQLQLPAGWNNFSAEVFDMQGKCVQTVQNQRQLDISALPAGTYIIRVMSGQERGFIPVVR